MLLKPSLFFVIVTEVLGSSVPYPGIETLLSPNEASVMAPFERATLPQLVTMNRYCAPCGAAIAAVSMKVLPLSRLICFWRMAQGVTLSTSPPSAKAETEGSPALIIAIRSSIKVFFMVNISIKMMAHSLHKLPKVSFSVPAVIMSLPDPSPEMRNCPSFCG